MYIWHTLTCALTITIQQFVVGEIVFNYYLCVYCMCGLVNLTLWGQNGPTKIAISMTWALWIGGIFGPYEESFSMMGRGRVWGSNIQFVQYKNHYVYGKFPKKNKYCMSVCTGKQFVCLFHSFIHACIHSCMHSFVHSFIHLGMGYCLIS